MPKKCVIGVNRRIRVIINGICFYTTKKQIINGVGDLIACNDAIRNVLLDWENTRGEVVGIGYSSSYNEFQVQLNLSE